MDLTNKNIRKTRDLLMQIQTELNSSPESVNFRRNYWADTEITLNELKVLAEAELNITITL